MTRKVAFRQRLQFSACRKVNTVLAPMSLPVFYDAAAFNAALPLFICRGTLLLGVGNNLMVPQQNGRAWSPITDRYYRDLMPLGSIIAGSQPCL